MTSRHPSIRTKSLSGRRPRMAPTQLRLLTPGPQLVGLIWPALRKRTHVCTGQTTSSGQLVPNTGAFKTLTTSSFRCSSKNWLQEAPEAFSVCNASLKLWTMTTVAHLTSRNSGRLFAISGSKFRKRSVASFSINLTSTRTTKSPTTSSCTRLPAK